MSLLTKTAKRVQKPFLNECHKTENLQSKQDPKGENNLQYKNSGEKTLKIAIIDIGKQSKKGFLSLLLRARVDLRQQLAKNNNNQAKKQRKRSA